MKVMSQCGESSAPVGNARSGLLTRRRRLIQPIAASPSTMPLPVVPPTIVPAPGFRERRCFPTTALCESILTRTAISTEHPTLSMTAPSSFMSRPKALASTLASSCSSNDRTTGESILRASVSCPVQFTTRETRNTSVRVDSRSAISDVTESSSSAHPELVRLSQSAVHSAAAHPAIAQSPAPVDGDGLPRNSARADRKRFRSATSRLFHTRCVAGRILSITARQSTPLSAASRIC